jgi:predicted dehydrogenase
MIENPRPERTRLSVIGAGGFAGFVCEALKRVPEIEIVAVADVDAARALSLAARLDVPAVDLSTVFADPTTDAVLIATPPSTHARLALDAIAADKDVFCEKPLGVTPEEADAVRDAAARNNRVVVVDHVLRYNPLLRAVRRLQDTMEWHPVRFLFENDAADESLPLTHWFWDESLSGGIFVEHGVHFFDAATMFIDEPATHVVATSARRTGWPSPDIVTATLSHGDCLATHTHSFTHAHRAERQLMRIDYGCAEVNVRGWIPVEASVDIFTDDVGLDRLLGAVYQPGFLGPDCRSYSPTVELRLDHHPAPAEACGRGVRFPASHHVLLTLSLGGEPAKSAVYAAGVADAARDLHTCRVDPRQQPRSGPGTAAGAVRTACAASESDRTGSRIQIVPGPPAQQVVTPERTR